jgi:hypothetical protein
VKKFTTSGVFVNKWGSEGSGDGQFEEFGAIAADSTGNVYVTDFSTGRVQKFTSDGTFLGKWGSWGSGDGQFAGPSGIAVDTSGNVYVTDDQNSRIEKFAPVVPVTTTPTTTITTPSIAISTAPPVLLVTSNPSGADIFIDGIQRGTTPNTIRDLEPGTHSVTVSEIGYLGQYSTVVLEMDKTTTLDVTLTPLTPGTGIISVRSSPPGASIVLDGKSTGKTTPYDFTQVAPGTHTVDVTLVEYGTYTQTFTVASGATVVVTTPWTYTPPAAVVFFNSDPAGATVYIDDALKGTTPLNLHLTPGTHIVKMTKDGYKDNMSALSVSSGDAKEVNMVLQAPGFEGILAVISLVVVVLFARKFR